MTIIISFYFLNKVTPTAYADSATLTGDAWRVYEFVTKHFLATVSALTYLIVFVIAKILIETIIIFHKDNA